MDYSKYFKSINYQSLSASTITEPKEKKRLQPYIENLKIAIQDPTVKNIAVFGKFGAGKTSVINTFLHDVNDQDKIRPLRLSTATFTRTNNMSTTSDEENGWVAIERNLVQQMLYGPKNSKLPSSKFRKIENINRKKWGVIAVLIILLIVFTALLVNLGGSLTIFFGNDNLIVLKKKLFICLLIDSIILIFIGFWYLPPYLSSLKLAVGKSELTVKDNQSAFNKYLDEIVYYFSRTKYNLVIFEDIDRADDLNIFEHLRELNQILNSNETIRDTYKVSKDSPAIKFLYAVKEDLFDNQMLVKHVSNSTVGDVKQSKLNSISMDNDIAEATTKFFDWTLTVLPRVSSSNASDFLMHIFNEPEPQFREYLRAVGGYFSDVRVLENAVNDFKLYLELQQGEDMDAEKLFTAVLFKNGFPSEYQRFLKNEGILSKLLRSRYFAEHESEKLNLNLKNLLSEKRQIIGTTEQDVVNKYKVLFFDNGADKNSTIKSYDGNKEIQLLADMTFEDIKSLYNYANSNEYNIYFDNRHSSRNRMSYEELIINEDKFNSDLIFNGNSISSVIDNLEIKIKNFRDTINDIETRPLMELAGDNPEDISDLLTDTNSARDFLTYAIVNGYFDESIDDYLTLFTGERISRKDRAVVLSIRSGRKVPFPQSIESIPNFVAELIKSDYPMPSMALEEIILYEINKNGSKKVNGLGEAFTASVSQLVKQKSERFTTHLDKLVNDISDNNKLGDLICIISERLSHNWSVYEGNNVEKIVPVMLKRINVNSIRTAIDSCKLFIDYLNDNRWNDAMNIVLKDSNLASQIYGSDKILVNKLDWETQSERRFADILIKNNAVICSTNTIKALLGSYRNDSKLKLSYEIAMESGNEVLRDYIKEYAESFLKSELKLKMISNESQKSVTALLQLPELSIDSTINALNEYQEKDLILSDFSSIQESEEDFPEIVQLILNSEKVSFEWDNLIYLSSLPNSDKKNLAVDTFIKLTSDLSRMPPISNNEEKDVLINVVNAHRVIATNDNKSILENVDNYEVVHQTDQTRKQLIEWNLVALDNEILDADLSQPEWINLGNRYLSIDDSDWDENQARLFQRLSIDTLFRISTDPKHKLNFLNKIAVRELSENQISNTGFSDSMKQFVIKAVILQNKVDESNETYIINLYNSMNNKDKQLKLLSYLCAMNKLNVSDKLIVKLLSLTAASKIDQLTDHSLERAKLENSNEVQKILKGLNYRNLTGSTRVGKMKKTISVYKLSKLKDL
ncbi:hypothetical protein CPR19088_GLDEOEPO_00816 [Companilactobacillus paralimentarius]